MIILNVHNVRKHYGPEPVLDGVTFDVRPGEKIGLVGPNGAGKTTLLRILTGQEESEGGAIELHRSAALGYLEQQAAFAKGETVWSVAQHALAPLLALQKEAEDVSHAIAEAANDEERAKLGERYEHLQHELTQRDAYHLDHKIEQILSGLGFTDAVYEQDVATLSGGQQNRLLLAKLLLTGADLLLLDEPSNHLDLKATAWLEGFLASTSQALIIVSHDRYLLDRTTNRTLELFNGTVDSYSGNFSAYWRQKRERLEVQRKTYEKQQEEIAKLEDFIRRNHHGQKHAQAEDRRKKLEKIEPVDPPREISAPPMGFPPAARCGDIVLRVESLTKGFTEEPLFRDVSFQIERGERWGILGPNGSGKTTFLRCLLDQLKPEAGNVIWGTGVKPAYFDQHLSSLDDNLSVADAIRPPGRETVEKERRDLLGRFGLTGDAAHQRVSELSGGERNRAALALLAGTEANFLILDEPTNHLDLWSRDSLERSLKKFDGTVMFVSHDRYFLNQVADHIISFDPPRFRIVEGDYDIYLRFTAQEFAREREAVAKLAAKGVANSGDAKSKRNGKEPKRKRKFPYRKTEAIEADIAACETRIEELHAALGSPEVLRDGDRVKETTAELSQRQDELSQLYEHWEEASELN